MRATAPAMKPVDVWDVLIASITTVGSIGEALDDFPTLIKYEDENRALASGADFAPPEKTIILTALLNSAPQKLDIDGGVLGIIKAGADLGATEVGHIGATYCDGTNVTYKNTDVAQKMLYLYGVSIK